jgi:hypothetical protein
MAKAWGWGGEGFLSGYYLLYLPRTCNGAGLHR